MPTSKDSTSIDAFLACRLIPLNKNLAFAQLASHVTNSTGSIQVCAGQDSGSDAAIHAMHDIFKDNGTEVILLIDAEMHLMPSTVKLC